VTGYSVVAFGAFSFDLLDPDAASGSAGRNSTGAFLKDRARAIGDQVIGQEMRGEKGQSSRREGAFEPAGR
jgi:hypothetical protein